ncbi:MAG: aldehyde ferredoxin oxidoreductase family protein [Candidatus Hadarchaeum sp.]|uniref:aldehyde ferredoxin oxidoreductase family protein n=1 Tax=Candidatus Hadarchaeum sp. TaxID=2883567 RepID=UPI003D0D9206
MDFKYQAYAGKIIRVNLTEGVVTKQPLDAKLAEDFLGGAGFITKILWDEVGPETAPLSPKNRLIFAVGPLCGTGWPVSCRFEVGAKSPLTGIYGDSSCCGHWGPELKFAGYDAIVFEGRASKPVYLWINNSSVKIMDASDLWGKTTGETEEMIRKDLGEHRIQVASCGPAGENLVRYASIISQRRAAARCGLGAVMGSKNLKAVAVKGTNDVKTENPGAFYEFMEKIIEVYKKDFYILDRIKFGTPILVELMNEIARWPVKNFQTGVFPFAKEIGGERIRSEYRIKDRGGFGCWATCEKPVRVKNQPYAGTYAKQPEYETLSALGARLWIKNLDAIIYANELCDELGLDTISTGGTISWSMECYEKGILTKQDTDGIELNWGNHEALLNLIPKIARREGFGAILAEGSYRAAQLIGRGSEKYLMTVKKMEIPAQDGRAQKSMGLAQAVASRGADHLKAFPLLDEVGREEPIKARFGEEYLPEMAQPLSPKYKAYEVKDGEELCVLCDSLSLCKSSGTCLPLYTGQIYFEDMAKILRLATGMKVTGNDLRRAGERIVNLQRAFNIREGLNKKDDTLPDRFTKTPAPEGVNKGHVVELDKMLEEYYYLRGWDQRTGLIPRKKLAELGLDYVADELEKLGKLPY